MRIIPCFDKKVWFAVKKELFVNKVVVRKSKTHGYGVFAAKPFKKGEIIEECYILVSAKGGDKRLEDYYFDVDGKYGIFTGFGVIYNHAENPNCDYFIYPKRKIAIFKANQPIKKGEEIFVSYGDKWFETRTTRARDAKGNIIPKKKAVKKKKKATKKKR